MVDQYHELGVSQSTCAVSTDHLIYRDVPTHKNPAVCKKEGGNGLQELRDWEVMNLTSR